MKKSTPPLIKHADHEVELRISTTKHAAYYYCIECKKWVAWASKQETEAAIQQGLVHEV